MENRRFVVSNNSKGYGMLEVIMASGVLIGIALVASSILTSIRGNQTRLASAVSGNNAAIMIGQQILLYSSPQAILSNPAMCTDTTTAVPPSATAALDPLCCDDVGNTAFCNATRRGVLCGSYGSTMAETQNIRSAATWARNFYVSCMAGTGGSCNITDNGGNICSSDGLIFDSTSELTTLFNLLPEPLDFASLDTNGRPAEVRLKIEVVSSASINSPTSCGTEPVWSIDNAFRITIVVKMKANDPNYQRYAMHLTWARDAFPPVVNSGTEIRHNAGPDNAVHADPADAANADNFTLNAAMGSYFADGTLKNSSQCTGYWAGGGWPSQPSNFTYVGWRKLAYQVQASEGGATFFCKDSFTASASDLNMCCDAINSGEMAALDQTGSPGTELRMVWNTEFDPGDQLAVGIADAQGNVNELRNFVFAPGFCPAANTYCADGSQAGIDPGPFVEAGTGPGKCSSTDMMLPGSTDSIFCRPHDGCFGFCPQGTRSAQNCPAAATYCKQGQNFDALNSRGCAPGIDCTMDVRCSNTVCDDCGSDACAASSITVAAKPMAAPYDALPDQFPTPYLGVQGCPNTTTYCPADAAIPATITGAGIHFLPKDDCGNSCPNGTRSGVTCPDPATYCSAGVNLGPRCVGAQCTSATDDCGEDCPASTIPMYTACTPPSQYCASTAPLPATPGGVEGTPQHLPKDFCGNNCPEGDRAPGQTCPANVYDPVSCPAAGPVPKDDCGWDCAITDFCACPDLSTVCSGTFVPGCGWGTLDLANVCSTDYIPSCGWGTKECGGAPFQTPPMLLKDINTTAGVGSGPNGFTEAGGVLYFSANDGTNGSELWKTNGTTPGTTMVKDILGGAGGSGPNGFFNFGGTLYFSAADANGYELWKSDGTSLGTTMVKDIDPGAGSSRPSAFVEASGNLFFAATTVANGTDLWKSDGTLLGTVLVKDIVPGMLPWPLAEIAAVGSTVYFVADDGVNGLELWKSDGTLAGTVLVKDIWAGVSDSNITYLINSNGTLFFTADDGIGGIELWKSNGTAAGTVQVMDIRAGPLPSYPSGFVVIGSYLYFAANDGINGRELWRTDGTTTVMVKDINPGANGSDPTNLVDVGGFLFFQAEDNVNGRELWSSDGTGINTQHILDIIPGAYSSFPSPFAFAGTPYTFAKDSSGVSLLWRQQELVFQSPGGIGGFKVLGGSIIFTNTDATYGSEIWIATP